MKNQTHSIRIVEKHPRVIRITHWLNFPVICVMVWSGILIYWAHPAYWPPIPDALFNALGIDHHLALGLSFHFFFMWIFAINGLIYFCYLFVSGEWREYVWHKDFLSQCGAVVLHELGIKKMKSHDHKFNAAQKVVYPMVILVGGGLVLTGLAIYKPIQVGWLKNLLGGYEAARLIHFYLTVFIVAFFFLHVGQVIKAGWNHFRSMVTGYEIKR